MTGRILRVLGIAVVALAIALAGTILYFRQPPAAPRDVRFAGPVAYRVLGHGRPVLVMLSGLGDGMATFADVAEDLSRTATVIVYDRAGYGASAAAGAPRDAAAVARELERLLAHSGVAGPYVLLGHSTGGLYAEYYAAKHPDQVAGLILEDARPHDFTPRCLATPGAGPCVPPAILLWAAQPGASPEFAALTASCAEVKAAPPLRGRRVLVLSRAVPPANPSPIDRLWAAAQNDLAARYPGARHLTAKDGGHTIHADQRRWFVAAVESFLKDMK
jgi:pimeloyl-ACP methyl ester carboxylesterase